MKLGTLIGIIVGVFFGTKSAKNLAIKTLQKDQSLNASFWHYFYEISLNVVFGMVNGFLAGACPLIVVPVALLSLVVSLDGNARFKSQTK